MERVALLDWDELTPTRASEFQLPEAVESDLPDSQLTIAVESESAPVDAKRVLLEIRWKSPPAGPAPAVRLAAWFHRQHSGRESRAGTRGAGNMKRLVSPPSPILESPLSPRERGRGEGSVSSPRRSADSGQSPEKPSVCTPATATRSIRLSRIGNRAAVGDNPRRNARRHHRGRR